MPIAKHQALHMLTIVHDSMFMINQNDSKAKYNNIALLHKGTSALTIFIWRLNKKDRENREEEDADVSLYVSCKRTYITFSDAVYGWKLVF